MEKREHRIVYKAGITRTPSDFLCEDGELAECINLTTDHEELKVVTHPKAMFNGATKSPIVYVHVGNGYKNYIYEGTYQSQRILKWFNEGGTDRELGYETYPSSSKLSVTNVGNILIVAYGTKNK